MTRDEFREELAGLLKENLEIEVSSDFTFDANFVNVTVLFDGEEIATGSCAIPKK
jgi:hypothetical protein